MASFQIKSSGRVFVYYWDKDEGKQKTLPRDQTSHLDHLPKDTIKVWVDNYVKTANTVKNYLPTLKDPLLKTQVQGWQDSMRRRGKKKKTIDYKYNMLMKYVLPYFSQRVGTDPNKWTAVSAKMIDYLEEQGLKWQAIQKCNTALRGFWDHLCD
jgi:hypothetical protein